MKPYYADEHVTLYHGDCREVLPAIEVVADLVIADPPYGETSLTWDRWPDGWPTVAADYARSMWCFGSMRMFLDRRDEFASWSFSQDVVWEKHNGSGFHADRFKRVHEIATHWYRGKWSEIYHETPVTMDATKRAVRRKERPTHTGAIESSTYISEDGGPRLQRSVIYARSMHGRALHPTEKSGAIIEPLIEYACPPAEIPVDNECNPVVLDLFTGSGAVLVVCKATGRRAVGIEADEQFCEVAAQRLSQGSLAFGEAL